MERIVKYIIAEYGGRILKSKVRYQALDKIETFINQQHASTIGRIELLLRTSKDLLKKQFTEYKGKSSNSA